MCMCLYYSIKIMWLLYLNYFRDETPWVNVGDWFKVKYQGIWYPGQLEDMEVDSRSNKPHYLISCLQVTSKQFPTAHLLIWSNKDIILCIMQQGWDQSV